MKTILDAFKIVKFWHYLGHVCVCHYLILTLDAMIHYCVKAISIFFFWKLYAYIQYFEVLQNDDFLLLYNCYFKVSQSYIITLVFGWVYPLHDSNWSFFRDFMFLVLGGVPTSSSTLKLVISPSISKSSMTTILLPFVHKLFSYL